MERSQRFSPLVIVPTYSSGAAVTELLRGVEALALPIIVLQGGGTDETHAAVRGAIAHAGGRDGLNKETRGRARPPPP